MKLSSLASELKYAAISNWQALLVCPALFAYQFAYDLDKIALKGLTQRQICLANYNTSICDHLKKYSSISDQLDKDTRQTLTYFNLCFIVPAIVALIHFTGDADRRLSYKTSMLVSAFGSAMQAAICIITCKSSTYWT